MNETPDRPTTPTMLVLSACSEGKAFEPVIDCADIDQSSKEELVEAHPDASLPARSLYIGDEHEYVKEAVEHFEQIAHVDWRIMSAGFGLVQPETVLPAYECTFGDSEAVRRRVERWGDDPEDLTKREQICRVAIQLRIPSDIQEALDMGPDVTFVALGKKYLYAAGHSLSSIPEETTVFAFAAKGSRDAIGSCRWVRSTETERAALDTILMELKGRQLKNVAENVATAEELLALQEADTVLELSLGPSGSSGGL